MVGAICSLLVFTLAVRIHGQNTPRSPCPNVFMYEPTGTEPGRWYGVVNLSTDSTLHSLWLNIVLDSKADILGNWVGDVSTSDNMDFKIENTKMKIQPGPATAVRFFIQYNPLNKIPRLQTVRLNGREICNANTPQPTVDRPDIATAQTRPDPTTNRPATTPNVFVVNPETKPTVESKKPLKPGTTLETKPVYGRPSGEGPVYVPTQSNIGLPNPYSIGGSQVPNQNLTQIGYPSNLPPNDQINQNDWRISSPQKQTGQSGNPYGNQGSSSSSNQKPNSAVNQNTPQSGSDTRYSYGQDTESTVAPAYGVYTYSQRGNSWENDRHTLTTAPPTRHTTDQDEDYDDNSERKPNPEDYFNGLRPVIHAVKPDQNANSDSKNQEECGRVVRQSPNPLIVKGKPTMEGQWPWQIALYQVQVVDNKYICGGTLVSHRHVITAAHCVTLKASRKSVHKNTLTVYLGKHNLRTSIEGVQIRFIAEITVHPEYNASSFSHDLGILRLLENVQYTDWVRPACLWPDDEIELTRVIGKRGSVVGWGFDDTGVPTEELTLVEMPVVDQETCIRSYSEFFARFTSDYTYCAGYRDGTSVCNGDSGGGMVFNDHGIWHLRGLVSLSVAKNADRCDPSHYVVFTDLAKFLPWIKSIIYNT